MTTSLRGSLAVPSEKATVLRQSVFMVSPTTWSERKVGTLYPGLFKKRKPCPTCNKLGVEATRWLNADKNYNIRVRCRCCNISAEIMDLYINDKKRNHEHTLLAIQQVLEAFPYMVAKELMGRD